MIESRKSRSLHDHREALADLPVRIAAFFVLAPLYHLAALFDRFSESAGAYRNNVSFTSFAQALEDLEHVAFLDVVLEDHILVVNSQLVGELAHGHHEAVCALRRSVALIRSRRRDVCIVDRKIVFHVVALEQRQSL